MKDSSIAAGAPPTRRGWISEALGRMFLKPAVVTRSEQIGDLFRLITLESPQFRGVEWWAGQKIKVATGPGLATRTYTPIEWDAVAGRTRILAHAHGEGPGSTWVRRAVAGETCEILGPRPSLDVRDARNGIVLFGDETSIGLACAIAGQQPAGTVRAFFEVDSEAEVSRAMALPRLGRFELFAREPGDRHLAQVEGRMSALVASGARFLLSGKASSIQRLHRALKTQGLARAVLVAKPYWAPGKTGLD